MVSKADIRAGALRMREKKKINVKSEPGFPVLGQAVPAIDWPSFGWLEGDFAFFTTVCADCLCHFSGTEIARATKRFSFHYITLAVVICM